MRGISDVSPLTVQANEACVHAAHVNVVRSADAVAGRERHGGVVTQSSIDWLREPYPTMTPHSKVSQDAELAGCVTHGLDVDTVEMTWDGTLPLSDIGFPFEVCAEVDEHCATLARHPIYNPDEKGARRIRPPQVPPASRHRYWSEIIPDLAQEAIEPL